MSDLLQVKWVPVVGFEDLYEISEYGMIRTIPRVYTWGMYNNTSQVTQKILQVKIDKDGYRCIGLRKNNVRHWKRLARLTCVAFHENPENKAYVNHKNGIRSDDRAENLEWSTLSENILHAYNVLGRKVSGAFAMDKRGSLNPSAKAVIRLSKDGVFIKKYDFMDQAILDGFGPSNICAVVRGKRKTHGGFRWEYA